MSFEAMNWAYKMKLNSGSEKLVLMALANYSNMNYESWPKHKTISNDVGICIQTVKSCLKSLHLAGHISWSNQYREDGSKTSNLYRLNINGMGTWDEEDSILSIRREVIPVVYYQDGEKGTLGTRGVGIPVVYQEPVIELKDSISCNGPKLHKESSTVSDNQKLFPGTEIPVSKVRLNLNVGKLNIKVHKESPEFLEFWKVWPTKKGRKLAAASWAKTNPSLTLVLEALRNDMQSEQWQQNSGKYIPMASTWLNQERYMDEHNPIALGRKRGFASAT